MIECYSCYKFCDDFGEDGVVGIDTFSISWLPNCLFWHQSVICGVVDQIASL